MATRHLWFVLPLALFPACSSAPADDGLDGPTDASPDALSDSSAGPAIVDNSDTEVWAVSNAWTDVTTPAAQAAGLAWVANSNTSWEQKFGAWLASLEKIKTEDGSNDTIQITTPYGKKIAPPHLECAETAMMLRATFASWYHLPFYMTGWDSHANKPLYAGHMGFVDATGHGVAGFPHFKAQYGDKESGWQTGADWPKDAKLRTLHLGDDDGVSFLENGAGAGAWFDEVVLNKRVGYFLRLLLTYFGSINLADSANLFNITPESIAPGDVLLERWQKKGIGHTIPLFRVDTVNGKPAPSVATGSMPRRQAVWNDPIDARHFFTSDETGGQGNDSDGNPYAKLGGGIHRWRTAVKNGGQWNNIVPKVDESVFISAKDTATIAARPKHFDDILAYGTPQDRRDAALKMIDSARTSLHQFPASCSSRTLREDGFRILYDALQQIDSKMDQATVDAQYRKMEDFVFAELDYTSSKTCCWDSSTTQMADIIMDNAQKEMDAAKAANKCAAPTVFKAMKNEGDGYGLWKQHAADMGRAGDWKAWSEDEPCAQKANPEDSTTYRAGDYCSVFAPPPPPAPDGGTDDGGTGGSSGAPGDDAGTGTNPDAGGS